MSRRSWAVVLVLGIVGCGEDATVKPANPAPPPITPSPKLDKTSGSVGAPPAASTPAVKSESATPAPKEKSGSAEAPPLEAPKSGAAEAEKPKLTEKQLSNIKKLPEAEQAAAIKQAVCPVSDEALGSMGTPIKVSAEGRSFYLCCDSCEDQVKSNPKKVLAKLDKSK